MKLTKLGLALCMWAVVGCASADKNISVLTMPAIRLEVASDGSFEAYDAEEKFKLGNTYFDRALWREAFMAYQSVVRDFKENDLTFPAMYNAGLALVKLHMYPEAADFFQAVVQGTDAKIKERSSWELLDVYLRSERWQEAQVQAHSLMMRLPQGIDVRELHALNEILNAWIGGASSEELKTKAEDYRLLLRKELVSSRVPEHTAVYFAARRIGDSLEPEKFKSLQFADATSGALSGTVLEILEQEAQKLLDAQKLYLRAIRISDPEWATASVYRIGQLYEIFYKALMSVELPEGLDPESESIYIEELSKELEPVRGKAELAYEKLLRFASQHVQGSVWVEKANESLKAIQEFDPKLAWRKKQPSASEQEDSASEKQDKEGSIPSP